MSEEPQAFIKTPRQLITVVVLAFVVPVLVIGLLSRYVNTGTRTGAGADSMSAEAIEARIRPVAGFELAGPSGPRPARAGEEVYKAQCATCHATGVADAPKYGDSGAWASRIKTGLDALVNSALKGKGAMAPQGGGEYTDLEVTRAVVYMANAAGGKFDEPKAEEAPGAAAQAAPAAAAAPAPAAAAPAPAAAPIAAAAPAPAAAAGVDGKKIYDTTCMVCHATGVAGAPKYGDKAGWADRIAAGMDTLVKHSIEGLRAMPPRGGNGALSDAEVHAAVDYMVAAVK